MFIKINIFSFSLLDHKVIGRKSYIECFVERLQPKCFNTFVFQLKKLKICPL